MEESKDISKESYYHNYRVKKSGNRKVRNFGSCEFVKSTAMVEYTSKNNGRRKMVHIVLLSDYLACVRYEDNMSAHNNQSYKLKPSDIKWVFYINEILVENEPEGSVDSGIETKELDIRRQLLLEHKQEMIKQQNLVRSSQGKGKGVREAKKEIGRLQKKIFNLQTEISLHAPTLGIRLSEAGTSGQGSNNTDKLRLWGLKNIKKQF